MSEIYSLPQIIAVDSEKCVNCHACIAVCPVKYCNDASDMEKGILVNSDLCIACGQCIKECSHEARYYLDDTERFFRDLDNGVRIALLAAPSAYVNFPNEFFNLLAWFKSQGVEKCIDVSFGAEITTFQYKEALAAGVKTPIIAQPCPAVVSFIELYKPNLLDHLAPTGSPVLDTATWFHSKYEGFKLAFLSPCSSKKREFEDPNTNGKVHYNVTIKKIKEHLKKYKIKLTDYSPIPFDGPAEAERGLLYSQPGGLIETFKRYNLNYKRHQIRKVEGPEIYTEYFDELEKDIANNNCDVILVDVLNCLHGCNRGTGTIYNEYTTDEILRRHEERLEQHINEHYTTKEDILKLEEILSGMKEIDFSRKYNDKTANFKQLLIPDAEQIEILNHSMGKLTKKDIKNCHACGYISCQNMATAILNGLYRPEQCHHFLESFFEGNGHLITDEEDYN